jgi:hypothetical protein
MPRVDRWMSSNNCAFADPRRALSSWCRSSSMADMVMPSGVRNSWLTMVTNRLFSSPTSRSCVQGAGQFGLGFFAHGDARRAGRRWPPPGRRCAAGPAAGATMRRPARVARPAASTPMVRMTAGGRLRRTTARGAPSFADVRPARRTGGRPGSGGMTTPVSSTRRHPGAAVQVGRRARIRARRRTWMPPAFQGQRFEGRPASPSDRLGVAGGPSGDANDGSHNPGAEINVAAGRSAVAAGPAWPLAQAPETTQNSFPARG